MIVNKPASRRTLGSDLARVDAHAIKPAEYKELPELTDDMLARAVVKKGGRSHSSRKKITLCLPSKVEDKAITAAARSDPDAQPLTPKQLKAMVLLRDRPRKNNSFPLSLVVRLQGLRQAQPERFLID